MEMSSAFRGCICFLNLFYRSDWCLWHDVPKEWMFVSLARPPWEENLRWLHRVLRLCSELRIAVQVRVSALELVERAHGCAGVDSNQNDVEAWRSQILPSRAHVV